MYTLPWTTQFALLWAGRPWSKWSTKHLPDDHGNGLAEALQEAVDTCPSPSVIAVEFGHGFNRIVLFTSDVEALLYLQGLISNGSIGLMECYRVGFDGSLTPLRFSLAFEQEQSKYAPLSEAHFTHVLTELQAGRIIQPIRDVRGWYNLPLKQAKDLVERIAEDHRLLRWSSRPRSEWPTS